MKNKKKAFLIASRTDCLPMGADFADRMKFFRFTPMDGTPAYNMKPKVTKKDIETRIASLYVLAKKLNIDIED